MSQLKVSNKISYQKVPCEAFFDAQQNQRTHLLKLFIVLKLYFPEGKTRLNQSVIEQIAFIMDAKSTSNVESNIEKLIELKWIRTNHKTGYTIFFSWDHLRSQNSWYIKRAMPVGWDNYKKIKALTGAVIYGYLYLDFWIKLRRKKRVRIKSRTYQFLSVRFDYRNTPAPVSIYGIEKIFNIPKSTASLLKKEAQCENYLKVIKDFSDPIGSKREMLQWCKLNDLKESIVYYEGNYHFQLIDLILPQFSFKKRKSIEP
ncbi:hypothetical protein [Aureitalea marina]|uniref:Uncharacterized protein n=1 Tax=Aureitalea marina TaxID=930804 RepID=A0A2S7KNE1_9FLAO|nr:hypothetical protein [Aureitalea marina]PQB04118.1 hypothetical protein BST85_03780 [Aureitalea marina]